MSEEWHETKLGKDIDEILKKVYDYYMGVSDVM